jgi:hypothetical protein
MEVFEAKARSMRDKKTSEIEAAPGTLPGKGKGATSDVTSKEVHRLLHQLNQPLTAISNYARAGIQLIDNGLADTARMKELFEKIAAQSARTTASSQDLGAAVTKLPREEQQ